MKESGCLIKARLPRRPQQRRSRERVEQILDTAAVLVAEAGTGEFSVPRLAQRLGWPRATIYKFFPTPESVLFGLADRYAERLGREFAGLESPRVADIVEVAARLYDDPVYAAIALSGVVAEDPTADAVADALARSVPATTAEAAGRELASVVIRSCLVHGLRARGVIEHTHKLAAVTAASACLDVATEAVAAH